MEYKEVKLSKSILDMKFMKKTKDRVEKEADDAIGQAMYSKEITEEMRKSGNIIFTEANMMFCNNLLEGRLSFGGMNKEIEKLMKNDIKKIEDSEKKKETDITDVEMAEGLSTTISNKFRKKNKHKKFKAPSKEENYL